MESGAIKDAQITASHWLYKQENSKHYDPINARLNSKSFGGAWCSSGIEENLNQYIQIDLLKDTKVTGIATQGRSKYKEYIEKFQLLYQRDGDSEFRMYNESGTWKVSTDFFSSKHLLHSSRNTIQTLLVSVAKRIHISKHYIKT